MTKADILDEISKLNPSERLGLVEAALHRMREEFGCPPLPDRVADRRARMFAAAKTLSSDYSQDVELTSFTTLDAEDFHAPR